MIIIRKKIKNGWRCLSKISDYIVIENIWRCIFAILMSLVVYLVFERKPVKFLHRANIEQNGLFKMKKISQSMSSFSSTRWHFSHASLSTSEMNIQDHWLCQNREYVFSLWFVQILTKFHENALYLERLLLSFFSL